MIQIRKSADRGHFNHGWLDTYHTFSFADYRDPRHVHFRTLRVINEDRVAGGGGFGLHPHRDMEIITYVLDGALQHADSLGNGAAIRPGEIQVMTAGSGIAHSEFNASPTDPVHLLQIWIFPREHGLRPRYDQVTFDRSALQGQLKLLVSGESQDGAARIEQDARIYATVLRNGQSVTHALASGRGAWIQIARGAATVNGTPLNAGDGAAITDESVVTLVADDEAEVLLFDLA